ncbi:hypothetical protein AVEN_8976-1 [Araneus ventricosus]|uniref:Uncharacterized protein n=1 Tax=Araneus ventricosus TaxID=182803 RepID=A0A4Y2KET1_ARAVE|nr:hypothetical protein AVEN_8976-1 [Araneus ventricosus]
MHGKLFKIVLPLMMSTVEEETSGSNIECRSVKQFKVSDVQSWAVWSFCQDLDLNAELAVESSARKRKPVPTVRSATVWRYCKMLSLDVKLEFPTCSTVDIYNDRSYFKNGISEYQQNK